MSRLRKKILKMLCLAVLSLAVGSAAATAALAKDVSLTLHEYDWTSYSLDHENAKQTASDGMRDKEKEAELKKYALKNVELTLIQITKGETGYVLDEGLRKYIFSGDKKMLAKKEYTVTQLENAMKKYGNRAENYVVEHKLGDYVLTTDENGEAKLTIPKKKQGLYLVVESKVPENVTTTTTPFVLSLPLVKPDGKTPNYNVHVYPKNQTSIPTVRKLVGNGDGTFSDSTSFSVGDTIYYSLSANIPKVTSDATKFSRFEFRDKLPVGMECLTKLDQDGKVVLADPESVKVRIYDTKEGAEQCSDTGFFSLIYGEDYYLVYEKVEGGNSVLRVVLTAAGLAKLNAKADGEHYISVTYPVKVGDVDEINMGDEGNRSDVTLYYGRTSNTDGEGSSLSVQAIKDAAVVLTYGIELQKTFDVALSNEELVEKVQFVVKNQNKNEYITAVPQTEEGSDKTKYGYYKVTGRVADQSEATTFSPNEEGLIVIDGLAAETYEVTELATVKGYALLKEPVIIEIFAKEVKTHPTTATYAGQEQEVSRVGITSVSGKEKATATVNGKEAEVSDEGRVPRVRLTVLNKKISAAEEAVTGAVSHINDFVNEHVNPKTGDTTPVLGVLLVMLVSASSFVLLLRRRKQKKAD